MEKIINKRLLEKPSLRQFLVHIYLIILWLFWLLVIVLFAKYMFKPIANAILPVSFSNLEQGSTIVDMGIKYQIVYIGDQRFRFPNSKDFIYEGGFFKSDKENNYMLIRLFWPDIAPNKIADFLPSINNMSNSLDKYFDTRIWVQIQGEDKAVKFNSNTFWNIHPELQPSEYIVHDDKERGLRVFRHKKHPDNGFSYSLNNDKFVELYGGMGFYYTPRIKVSIGGYGYPSLKDIHGNPSKWQDVYQGVVSVLDRYHEVERNANR
jgi:hypothetical protein